MATPPLFGGGGMIEAGELTWPAVLGRLIRRESLTRSATAWAMAEIMSGAASPVQIGAFASLLRAKGERTDELAGLVETMLATAEPVVLSDELRARAIDVVGTGGDGSHSVNISTMSAIVVAAAGVPVAKHGNRAASSSCGSADLLEALDIPVGAGPDEVASSVTGLGIGFCFAPRFHPGMRHAGPARKELGVPTTFNFLGPLANPARPKLGLIGCADDAMAVVMAEVFADRGDTVLVVRGEDGLDEVTTTGPTRGRLVYHGQSHPVRFDVGDLGVARSVPGDLRGGDAACNADAARSVFAGAAGPVRDAVLVNAGAALAVSALAAVDPAPAMAGPGEAEAVLLNLLAKGIEQAAETVDSGAAAAKVTAWSELARSTR